MLKKLLESVFCDKCIAPKAHPTHIFHRLSGWHG